MLHGSRFQWRPVGTAALAWTAAASVLGAGAIMLCFSPACATPRMDNLILGALHALQAPWLTVFFSAATWIGSMWLLLPASLALCAWKHNKGESILAWLTPLALVDGWLLAHLTKLVVERPRPTLHEALVTLPEDSSFPSAHTMQIAAFSLAALFALGQQRQWLPVLFASLVVATVAMSRLYLQVHFPTDVLFGLMAAIVWTGGLYYAMARKP